MAKDKAEIMAYITLDRNRVFSGNPLILIARDAEEQKLMVRDIAIALRAEVSQLKCGDYIIIK